MDNFLINVERPDFSDAHMFATNSRGSAEHMAAAYRSLGYRVTVRQLGPRGGYYETGL